MADITRDQFSESKGVCKKIFQRGRFVVDADLNELQDVLKQENRRKLSCMVHHENHRFGDGFKVVGTGASLQVTVKAGLGTFHITDEVAVLLRLASDYLLTGFSPWPEFTNGGRTDYVYLDIWEDEIDASEDPDIVNPAVGEETCRDLRLKYTINISEDGPPGTPPTGHTYVSLASIYKVTGNNIYESDVTNLIPDHFETAFAEMGAQNILKNSEFDHWTNGGSNYPDNWAGGDLLGVSRETSIVRFGKYSAKLDCDAGMLNPYFHQIVDDHTFYAGKRVKAVAYVRLASAGAGKWAKIRIYDGGVVSESSAVVLTTQWQKLEHECELSTSPTTLQFRISFNYMIDTDVYVDGCALFVGRQDRDYETHLKDKIDRAAKQMWNWSYKGTLPTNGAEYLFKENIDGDGFLLPFPCSITKIYVYQGTAPTGGEVTYWIYKNGDPTNFSVTLPMGSQNANTSGLEDFDVGDRITIKGSFGVESDKGADAFVSLEVITS